MFEKRKRTVFETAKSEGLIEADEELRTGFICQTFASPLVLSPIVTMFVAGQRMMFATDRNVYTIEVSKWRTSKPVGVVSKHALGSTTATKRPLSLQIEGEEKLYAFLFQFADMKKIEAAINSGGSAVGEIAPQGQASAPSQ